MKRIRTFIVYLCFFIFGSGAAVINFIVFPVCKILFKGQRLIDFYDNTIHKSWKFFTWILIVTGLIRLHIKDIERIKNIKNKVIVSTHPSLVDVVILIGLIPKTTCFVKKKLLENPLLKNILNSIFITSDIEIEEFKIETKKMLDEGYNIIIFPTGTRYKYDGHLKLKKGAALIAANAKKNIVPIKITNDYDFLFSNKPVSDVG